MGLCGSLHQRNTMGSLRFLTKIQMTCNSIMMNYAIVKLQKCQLL